MIYPFTHLITEQDLADAPVVSFNNQPLGVVVEGTSGFCFDVFSEEGAAQYVKSRIQGKVSIHRTGIWLSMNMPTVTSHNG
jgi:hypothetical protein